jgi:hypothetical protein
VPVVDKYASVAFLDIPIVKKSDGTIKYIAVPITDNMTILTTKNLMS